VNGREKLNAVPLGGEICFGEDITEAKAANSGHVGVTKNSNTELIKTKIA